MENAEETVRLESKTDPEAVRRQAKWCGLRPGIRVMDAGCGPGKTSSILWEMSQPGGSVLGLDYSEERIAYAREHYAERPGIQFHVHDLRDPVDRFGSFDLIWVRFVLEYDRREAFTIVKNLWACLRPGGMMCLMDLDHNCLSHYELPDRMETMLFKMRDFLEENYAFDFYAGRKLYAYLYDMGFEKIELNLEAHHLFYGEIKETDFFNWFKKAEVISKKASRLFEEYPGGRRGFFDDFKRFFSDSRRFSYTPLILCKGMKPLP